MHGAQVMFHLACIRLQVSSYGNILLFRLLSWQWGEGAVVTYAGCALCPVKVNVAFRLCGMFYSWSLVVLSRVSDIFRYPGGYVAARLAYVLISIWVRLLVTPNFCDRCCLSFVSLKRDIILLNFFWFLRMTFFWVTWRCDQICLGCMVRMLYGLSLHVVFIVQSDLRSFVDILDVVAIVSENELNGSCYNM